MGTERIESVRPPGNASVKRLLVASFLLAALAAAPCAAQTPEDGQGYRAALRVDLRPAVNGFNSGGWGVALGGELVLGGRFSLVADLQYLDLADGDASLATLHVGPRVYLAPRALHGLFAGAYALGRQGTRPGDSSFGFGLMLEAGWAWLPPFLPGLIVEPYVKYPWFFGEEVLVGIAPGLALGWAF